ncbi:MAG: hypothetical protein M0Z31_15610 [Clostridia bacterium]|nr:hypothetical protein [Clostridia bacterium]
MNFSPRTSFTTIKENDNYFVYGDQNDKATFTVASKVYDGKIISTYLINNKLEVQQNLEFVKGSTVNNRQDVVEIEYVLSNLSNENIQSGVRIMLDTMLGSNDGAPFRIPGHGAITSEKEFVGEIIPNYWQAFDSLTDPTVISQGTFIRGSNIKPQKIQFASWSRVYGTVWNYTPSTGTNLSDSAVALYWEFNLAPNETKTVRTYYGLSGFNQDLRPPLSLSVAAESEVAAVKGKYNPNPIALQAFVNNISNAVAKNVKLTVELPEGLYINEQGVNKQSLVIPLGTINPGEENNHSVPIHIKPQNQAKEFTYKIHLDADLVERKTLLMKLKVPAISQGSYPAIENIFGSEFKQKLSTVQN